MINSIRIILIVNIIWKDIAQITRFHMLNEFESNFLNSHLDYFPENRDLVSEQQAETSFKLMKGWKDPGHWNGWKFLLGVASENAKSLHEKSRILPFYYVEQQQKKYKSLIKNYIPMYKYSNEIIPFYSVISCQFYVQ